MDSALVVGEHPVPALVVRTVSKHVLPMMACSSYPIFDDQTLVQRKGHGAVSIARRTCRADLPIAEPLVKLAICRIRSARIGTSSGKNVCCEDQTEQNGEKDEFRGATLENQD